MSETKNDLFEPELLRMGYVKHGPRWVLPKKDIDGKLYEIGDVIEWAGDPGHSTLAGARRVVTELRDPPYAGVQTAEGGATPECWRIVGRLLSGREPESIK